MDLIGRTETSVSNYHYSLHKNPEEGSSLRGGNMKSHIICMNETVSSRFLFTKILSSRKNHNLMFF